MAGPMGRNEASRNWAYFRCIAYPATPLIMRLRPLLAYLSILPLGACTRSCNDYDNASEFYNAKLPEYTETGANTLGCRLGPQVWTVLGKHEERGIGYSWQPNFLASYNYTHEARVTIQGQMTGVRDSKTFYDMGIALNFEIPDTLGRVQLLGINDSTGAAGSMSATNYFVFDWYVSRPEHPVRLIIRKVDRQQHIVSGVFEGCLYGDASGQDSLVITDGRFDVKYIQ